MDNTTYHVLGLYYEREHLSLVQLGAILNDEPVSLSQPVAYLVKNGYLQYRDHEDHFHKPDTPIDITYAGKVAYQEEKKARSQFSHQEFRAWATLAIAILALILSILGFK